MNLSFLADRAAPSVIAYWHHTVVCMSVPLFVLPFVPLCIVAKRYILGYFSRCFMRCYLLYFNIRCRAYTWSDHRRDCRRDRRRDDRRRDDRRRDDRRDDRLVYTLCKRV